MYTASKSPWKVRQVSDDELLRLLDGAQLTVNERKSVEAGMAYMVAEGSLPKTVRDHLCAIARAKNLMKRTAYKKREGSPIGDVGFADNFSVRRTAGSGYAEGVLGTKLSEDGKRIVRTKQLPLKPPGRAA